MQTLLWCLYSPRVQSHASVSAHTLKTPQLADMPFFGHMKILHTLIGMGSTARVAAVPYPGKATKISHKGQRSTKKLFTVFGYAIEGALLISAHLSAEISPKSHIVSTQLKNLQKVWVLRQQSTLF